MSVTDTHIRPTEGDNVTSSAASEDYVGNKTGAISSDEVFSKARLDFCISGMQD